MTASDGEKVPASERLLNIATSATGLGVLGAGARVSGKLATKIDNIVSKIPSVYKENFKCMEFANEFEKALKKSGINGKVLKVTSEKLNIISKNKNFEAIAIGSKYEGKGGIHVGIQIGDKVYDNLHPNGIPYDQWISDFEGQGIKIKIDKEF
jgi:hypothetical protein